MDKVFGGSRAIDKVYIILISVHILQVMLALYIKNYLYNKCTLEKYIYVASRSTEYMLLDRLFIGLNSNWTRLDQRPIKRKSTERGSDQKKFGPDQDRPK